MSIVHTPTIESAVTASDAAIELHGICCGDPATRSVRTVYGIDTKTQADLQAEVDAHKLALQTKHQAMLNAQAFLQTLVTP